LNGKSVTILAAILILFKKFENIEDALNFVINVYLKLIRELNKKFKFLTVKRVI